MADPDDAREPTPPAEPPPDRARRAFWIVVPVAGLFVLTIFAMVATTFGDPAAPLARFFDEHGLAVIAVEALLLVVACVAAMTVDRWHTLRKRE